MGSEMCIRDSNNSIRKTLHPFPRLVPLKDPDKQTANSTTKTPVIKRTLLSRGVPLVNKTLTLERMQKVREKKLQECKPLLMDDSLMDESMCSATVNINMYWSLVARLNRMYLYLTSVKSAA